jgi:hypothetical protein
MLHGFSLGKYLLLIDYIRRLFRDGKAAISAELAGILERLGTSAETWHAWVEKLKAGSLPGRFFAGNRKRPRAVASQLRVHHLANLSGYPTRECGLMRVPFPSSTPLRATNQPAPLVHASRQSAFLPPSTFRSLCVTDQMIVPTPRRRRGVPGSRTRPETKGVGESRGDKTPFVPPGGTPPSSAVREQSWRSTASFAWLRPNGMILNGGLSGFGHAQAAVFGPYSRTGEAADCEMVLQYL